MPNKLDTTEFSEIGPLPPIVYLERLDTSIFMLKETAVYAQLYLRSPHLYLLNGKGDEYAENGRERRGGT